jgi:hypothetical protein
MPVYQILDEMPYDELLKWTDYFRKRPANWDSDHRTYMLLRAWGAKGKPEEYFPSLRLIKIAEEGAKTEQAGKVAPSGRFLEMMKKARGGDKLDIKPWEK